MKNKFHEDIRAEGMSKIRQNRQRVKSKKTLQLLLLFALLISGMVFMYFAFDTFVRLREEQSARRTSDMIWELFERPTGNMAGIVQNPTSRPVAGNENDAVYIDPRFAELADAFDAVRELTGNDDIVAYIYIAGTTIGYVVLQGENNIAYLHRDMFGQRNAAGSVFLDYLNSSDFTDPNTIIYGHNMRNQTKFYSLRYYIYEETGSDFLQAHPYIMIMTAGEVLVYEIFSVFITGVDFYYIQVNFGAGEFEELVDELNRRNMHDVGRTATPEDNLLLLSTCSHFNRTERIVVAGRLVQRIGI